MLASRTDMPKGQGDPDTSQGLGIQARGPETRLCVGHTLEDEQSLPLAPAGGSLARMRALAGTGLPRPPRLLAATVGLQWLVTAGVALSATSTGSVYGDLDATTGTITAASNVASGALPATSGPLYPLLLAPLAAVTTDPGTVTAVATTFTLVVLAPLASYFMLEIAQGIAGRLYAIAVVLAWLLLPIAALLLINVKYESTYTDHVLPALYGLTLHPAYLAMVLSLASAAFALRATAGAPGAGLIAGLTAAATVACLPIAAGIAAGIGLALLVARRWRGLGEVTIGFVAGLAPTLIWRHRALDATFTVGNPSWTGFQATMANVREYSWSNRLLQWLPIAGAVGLFRLARPAATMIAGWLVVAAILGVATAPPFDRGKIFIELIPAWPAYALAAAAIPALVPTLIRRLGSRLTAEPHPEGPSRALMWTAFALVAVLPLAIVSLIGR